MSDWKTTLKNAKKTCIQQGNLRKVHYELPSGKEMVEEYNMDTSVVTRRAWKVKKELGGEGQWSIEVGDPEPAGLSSEQVLIKENSSQPFVTRRITKKSLEWRIRNLPYPVETYNVGADPTSKCISIRTTNKKYFKKLPVPEIDRLNLLLEEDKIEFKHRFNTLIITYEKPQELIDFENVVFDEVKTMKAKNEGDMDCKPS